MKGSEFKADEGESLGEETYLQTTQDGKIEYTGVATTVQAAADSGN
jgi:hypothetical protein